jgi:tetratricopeptide (TPR) repeat protein
MFRTIQCCMAFGIACLLCAAQTVPEQSAPPPSTSTSPVNNGGSQLTTSPVPVTDAASTVDSMLMPPNLLGEALAFYRKGDLDHAIDKYQALLRKNPKSPDAFTGLARCYLKQEHVERALQIAEQGLAVTDAPRTRVAHAEVLFRQGKITEAEKEWVTVVNSGYPDARAYLGLARVRNALAMYKSGEEMIDKAYRLDPKDPDVQQLWVETLPRSQRIKYLETSLADKNNWNADQRSDMASYLDYLKEGAKKSARGCRLVSKVTSTEAPLVRLLEDPKHLRGYGLTVELNGHKNSLLLDTGASGIVVRRGIAERAGISKVTETKIWGVGDKGKRDAYIGTAESIKIGELEFQNCPVEVIESRSVADENGLIGADVFEDFLVDLDFPNEKLKLGQLPKRPGETAQNIGLKSEGDDSSGDDGDLGSEASQTEGEKAKDMPRPSGLQDRYIAPEMRTFTPVLRFGHDLLVPTRIGDVPYKLFLLDTGALINAISPSAAREVTKVHGDSDAIVKGVSGTVDKVYSANKAVLQFGHLRQENQDITAFDTTSLSNDVGTEISGFLGFAMLRFMDIKIDYRDALVDFSYDAKRWNF